VMGWDVSRCGFGFRNHEEERALVKNVIVEKLQGINSMN